MTKHTTQDSAGRRKRKTESIPLENPDHLHFAYERSPFAWQSLSAEGCIEQVNQAWLDLLGYTREEVVGRSFAEFITPSTRAQFPERFAYFRRIGKIEATQWDMVRKDGCVVTVEFDGRASYDAQGEFLHSHCIARDVTDRNKAAQALQLSEQTYRTLIDGLPDIVMRFDRDGRHLFVSENITSIANIPADRFVGKTHRELGFPEDKCRLWEEAIRSVFDTSQACESEFVHETQKGQAIFNWRLLPELDANSRIVSVLSICRDVTASRQSEQKLHESERRYRLLFDQMLSGVMLSEIITDNSDTPIDFRFLSINAAFKRMTGLKAEDVQGKAVREVFPEIDMIWIERCGRVALTGEPTQFEEYFTPLGRYYEVRAYSPKSRQFAVVFNDVTERRTIVDELRDSQEKLATIFDSAPVMMLVLDENRRVRAANRAALEATGHSPESIRDMRGGEAVRCIHVTSGPYGCGLGPFCTDCTIRQIVADTVATGHEHRDVTAALFSTVDGQVQERYFCVSTARADTSMDVLTLVCIEDITERRKAEDALRQSEIRLRSLYESAQAGIIVLDTAGHLIHCNPVAAKILGMTWEDMRSRTPTDPIWQMVLEDGTPVASEDHPSMITIRTGRPIRGAVRGIFSETHDRMRWLLINTEPQFNADSRQVEEVIVTFLDITDLKQATESLCESEEKFRAVFDKAPDSIMLIATDTGEITEFNDRAHETLGYTRDEFRQIRVSDIEAIKSADEIAAHIATTKRTGTDVFETQHRTKDGRLLDVLVNKRTLSLRGRQFILSTWTDITQRKLAEKALEIHRAELQAIYDHTPVMMCVLDDNRRLCYANRAFETFSGTSESEVKGRSFCDVLGCTGISDNPSARAVGPKCILCQLRQAMEDTLDTGTSHHNIEYHGRVQGPDDIHEIVLLGATAIVQSGDKPSLLLCLQDVTEPRLAMDRAKQREAELAHVSRLTTLGEMATGLAHELNQPLSAILNYGAACSKLVGAQTPDLKRIAVNLDRIVAQADRAAQIMARIRAFAQRRPPRLGPVDLARAVTRVIELLSWDIRQKCVDVELELADALAPVEADAVQIDQVLLNLAKNAIEAMQGVPRNRRQLTIRANTIDGDTVRVEVSDTGIGLPEENADRVFEAFFSTKPDGLGIGLSISRTIVEMHGGTLEAYNHPGPGCTFVMALPPARSTEPPGGQPSA